MATDTKDREQSARAKRLEARKEKAKRYWEARAQARVRATDRDNAQVQAEVREAYQAAADNIGESINALYKRFATDAGITLAEARKVLKPSELNDYKRELAKKRKAVQALIVENPDNRRLKRYDTEFQNLSKINRLTREQMVQSQLKHTIIELGVAQERAMDTGLKAQYESALTGTDADLGKLSVDTHIAVPTPTNTERVVREKWLGKDFSERIWTDKEKLIGELRAILSQGFIQNDGIDAMSRQLVQRMNVSMSNARRLIRTEFNHIANQGSLAGYKERKVKQYRFLAAIDSRTSEICESLHNQVFNVEDAEVGVNFPPMHPWCRSTTVAVFDDDDERYDFSHIELTKEELRELGIDAEEKPPAPTLTEREVRAAEREMQSREVEARTLKRIEHRAESLIDTAHVETKALDLTQGRVEYEARWQSAWLGIPQSPTTVAIEEERLIDLKERIEEHEQGVVALEERMAEIAAELQPDAPPPPEPLSIDSPDEGAQGEELKRLEPFPKEERKDWALPDAAPPVVVKAKRFVDWLRAAVEKVKAGFNRIVERLREFVERLMPQPAYAVAGGAPLGGVQVHMMAGQGSGGRGFVGRWRRPEQTDAAKVPGEFTKLLDAKAVRDWEALFEKDNPHIDFNRNEFKRITEYSAGAHEIVNALERLSPRVFENRLRAYNRRISQGYKKRDVMNMSNELSQEIGQFKLKRDITVLRQVADAKPLFEQNKNVRKLEDLKGRRFTEKGFLSTSIEVNTKSAFGGIGQDKLHMYIDVPKGTKAAYIERFTGYADQKELLLDKGQRFTILDAGRRVVGQDRQGNEIWEDFIHLRVQ